MVWCSWQQAVSKAQRRTYCSLASFISVPNASCCKRFAIARLLRLKFTIVQQHRASHVHALGTMLAPAPAPCSVFPSILWHALLQDVSYEPECQVWSIGNDALQTFVLSYS